MKKSMKKRKEIEDMLDMILKNGNYSGELTKHEVGWVNALSDCIKYSGVKLMGHPDFSSVAKYFKPLKIYIKRVSAKESFCSPTFDFFSRNSKIILINSSILFSFILIFLSLFNPIFYFIGIICIMLSSICGVIFLWPDTQEYRQKIDYKIKSKEKYSKKIDIEQSGDIQ